MQEARLSGTISVLIASTDARVRKLVSSTLARDRRFDVVAQETAGDTVVARGATFDVALVDVAISGLGILGVLSGLRRSVPQAVVIVVSRTDAIYLRHACLAEGAADYLVLPDELPELPDRLARLAKTASAGATSQ